MSKSDVFNWFLWNIWNPWSMRCKIVTHTSEVCQVYLHCRDKLAFFHLPLIRVHRGTMMGFCWCQQLFSPSHNSYSVWSRMSGRPCVWVIGRQNVSCVMCIRLCLSQEDQGQGRVLSAPCSHLPIPMVILAQGIFLEVRSLQGLSGGYASLKSSEQESLRLM